MGSSLMMMNNSNKETNNNNIINNDTTTMKPTNHFPGSLFPQIGMDISVLIACSRFTSPPLYLVQWTPLYSIHFFQNVNACVLLGNT